MLLIGLVLIGLLLIGLGSCSDAGSDDVAAHRADLAPLLLTDSEIDALDLGLMPKESYSTGEDYGAATDEELAGPTEQATAAVVRQWTRDPTTTPDGVPWSVDSTVIEFSSPADAADAVDAIFAFVGSAPTDLGNARYALAPPEEGVSSGVALTLTESTLYVAQAHFDGTGDEAVIRELAELLVGRGR